MSRQSLSTPPQRKDGVPLVANTVTSTRQRGQECERGSLSKVHGGEFLSDCPAAAVEREGWRCRGLKHPALHRPVYRQDDDTGLALSTPWDDPEVTGHMNCSFMEQFCVLTQETGSDKVKR